MKNAAGWYLLLLNPFVFSIILLGFGLTRWRDEARYGVLRTVSYAQAAREVPFEGWTRITGCRIDLSLVIMETHTGTPIRVYAPIFDRNNFQQRATRLFAELDDSATLRLMMDRDDMEKQHSPQEFAAWMNAHRDAFLRFEDMTGLARQGIRGLSDDADSKFAGIAEVPVAQLVVVTSGWSQTLPGRENRWASGLSGPSYALQASGAFFAEMWQQAKGKAQCRNSPH